MCTVRVKFWSPLKHVFLRYYLGTKAQSNKLPLYSFGTQINYETWSFDYSLRLTGWNMEFNDC